MNLCICNWKRTGKASAMIRSTKWRREIVDWILAHRLPVRFQLQMHKFIWTPTQRGV